MSKYWFLCKIAYKKVWMTPNWILLQNRALSDYSVYKIEAPRKYQQNIMKSYQEISTSVFSLLEKNVRTLFSPKKKRGGKFFFRPPKNHSTDALGLLLEHWTIPTVPTTTNTSRNPYLCIPQKKFLSEGPLPHTFWHYPQENDYL